VGEEKFLRGISHDWYVKSNHVTSTRVHDHVQGPLVFLNMYI
jgi:hypothetical protein